MGSLYEWGLVGSGERPGRWVEGFSENVLDRCDEANESAGDNGDGKLEDGDEAVEIRELRRCGRGCAATAWFVADMVGWRWVRSLS